MEDSRPVAATVTVLEVDRAEDGSSVRTDPDVGDYHRLLLPGLFVILAVLAFNLMGDGLRDAADPYN